MDVVFAQLPRFLNAVWTTIWIFAVVSLLSTLIGAAIVIMSDAWGRWLSMPASIYTWIFRGLPELVVLFACYLALPQIGISLSPAYAAVLAFTLIGVAFQIEIFRAGIASVDARQFEAARALGIGWGLAMRRLILPQVARAIVPPWITYAAGALKAMSLASAIAVTEVMFVTRQTMAISSQPFTLILFVAALYSALVSILLIAEHFISRHYARRYGLARRSV